MNGGGLRRPIQRGSEDENDTSTVSSSTRSQRSLPIAVDQNPFYAPSRMSQMFGLDLSRVRITTNSPAATGAMKAVTKDGQVHFY